MAVLFVIPKDRKILWKTSAICSKLSPRKCVNLGGFWNSYILYIMSTKLFYEKPSIEVLDLRVEGVVCSSDPEDQNAGFEEPGAILDDLTTIIWF